MKLLKINKLGELKLINKDNIDFITKNKNISKLNSWNYKDYMYVLYGCINGNANEENKYDLPPPCDCDLFFNDLYFIKYINNNIVDLELEEYDEFYNNCFEGFDTIENTDDEIEDELSVHTSDNEFINDEDISVNSDTTEDLESNSNVSDFTSEEKKNTTSTNEENDEENNEENNEENECLSSISITISSCSDIEIDTDEDITDK
tara:strand:+ start:2466 stop:3080 length:615 start_codon:yes stop_codon:yes gene_type:complete